MIFAGSLPPEGLDRAGSDQKVLQPLPRRVVRGGDPVPTIRSRHEDEPEVVHVTIKLTMSERGGVPLGGAPPFLIGCPLVSKPHHPCVEPRTPVGPDVLRTCPSSSLRVDRSRLVRGPLREHSFELSQAKTDRALQTLSESRLVN